VTVLPSQFTPWTERGKPKRESFLEDGMANQQLTFEEVTSTEWHLIEELHVVKQPKTIGTGNDAQTGWRKGEGEPCMKVLAIWKVNHSEVLEKYIEEIELLQSREEDYWVETVNDNVQHRFRQEGLTKKHEYLLLHGSCPENLKSILKTGINNHVAAQTSYNFGEGSYLADAADKADQHLAPDEARNEVTEPRTEVEGNTPPPIKKAPQEKLPYITSVVGGDDKQLIRIREHLNEEGENAGRICIGLVVRAALGKSMELQLAEDIQLMEKNKDNVGGRSDFHWHNPGTGEKMIVGPEHPRFKDRLPPWGPFRDDYDSVKVMSGMYNPEYQKEWSKKLGEGPATNAFPFRFNEYLVPFAGRKPPRVAVQYLVAYERRRGDKGA